MQLKTGGERSDSNGRYLKGKYERLTRRVQGVSSEQGNADPLLRDAAAAARFKGPASSRARGPVRAPAKPVGDKRRGKSRSTVNVQKRISGSLLIGASVGVSVVLRSRVAE